MIYINGKFLTQQITGVQKFALEITCQLIKINSQIRILVPKDKPIYYHDKSLQDRFVQIGTGNIFSWEQITLPRFLKSKNNPLLLNFTGLGPIYYKNKITTIHDLSFCEHPEWFSKKYALTYRALTPIAAKNSRQIITVSNYSKNVIIEKLGVEASKTRVIYNAVNGCKCKPEITRRAKQILAVGSLDPRKNLERLIKAFLKWNNMEYKLIIVGGKQKSFSKLNFPQNENIIFTGYVTDDALHKYYCSSEIFIYPSLYEGFGIPPLEAMSHEVPVITSDATSLPEVCGDAAIYIDPHSVDSIANALKRVTSNAVLKKDLVELGLKNTSRFSWEKSAQKIDNIISSL